MELKYKDLFLDSFIDLTTSNGLYELNTRLSDWISKIFGSENYSLLFIDKKNQLFKKYDNKIEKSY